MNYKEIINRVYNWNASCGNAEGYINFKLEKDLFEEEYNEFLEAKEKWDKVEALDWAIDCLVIFIWSCYKAWIDKTTLEYNLSYFTQGDDSVDYYIDELDWLSFDCRSWILACLYLLDQVAIFTKDIEWAITEVLDSNDSKLTPDENWALYAQKNANWKIIKPSSYFKPNLEQFIWS